MTFLAPTRLWLLLAVVALAVAYVLVQRRRRAYAVRFTNLALLDRVAPKRPGWRRHAPAAVFLAMLVLLVTGFARPTSEVRVPRERATLLLAIDTSVSMQATDVDPDRVTAAKGAASAFLDKLPARFNVGLVAFNGSASVVVPPTTDREQVRRGISGLQLGPRTAIGEAIFTSLQAIETFDAATSDGEAPPRQPDLPAPAPGAPPAEPTDVPARIVLLSDGENTAGRTPEQATEAAATAEVPVYTIAYGSEDGYIEAQGQRIPVPVDGPALEEIADGTGGRFYEAATGEELDAVYADIGSSIGYRTERQEVSSWFIGAGLLAALVAAAASLAWFSRLP